jgi:hypothetical protein
MTAIASLIMANTAKGENLQNAHLSADQYTFIWDHWDVRILDLSFRTRTSSGVMEQQEVASSDVIFVYVNMEVRNISHEGRAFIPQNSIKLILGANSYDAEDIDPGWNNIKNIEPTLDRNRQCYFEVPRAELGDSFVLRFSEWLSDSQDIKVSVTFPSPPAPTPTPQPVVDSTPEPASTPTPIVEATPQTVPQVPVTEATPVPRLAPRESQAQPDPSMLLLLDVDKALNDHDWRTLTSYTADGLVNYFGKLHCSNVYIRHDMEQDAITYSGSHSTRYLDTFTHEVSNEYSPHWKGPMMYDSINVYSEVQERHGRLHKALSRLTVGYTLDNGLPTIYSLTSKVLPN